MATRYRASDYLYATARIRAVEGRLLGRDKLNRLSELQGSDAVLAALSSEGVTLVRKNGAVCVDETLDAMLREGFCLVREATDDPAMGQFLQYPYDCNNIKAILKAESRGLSLDGLLCELGSVEIEDLPTRLSGEDLSFLPSNMASAVPEARKAFFETGNPQSIDFVMDRACYADMLHEAREIPFALRYMMLKIDTVNLLMALRLSLLWGGDVARAMLSSAMLAGGTLSEEVLSELAQGGKKELENSAELAPFAAVLAEETLFGAEKRAEDLLMELVRQTKYLTEGADVPVAYLLALDTSVKNLRIMLAGKATALSPEQLRGRMRESYV